MSKRGPTATSKRDRLLLPLPASPICQGGLDQLDRAYQFPDMTAFGRREAWEEPKGSAPEIRGAL